MKKKMKMPSMKAIEKREHSTNRKVSKKAQKQESKILEKRYKK